MVLISERLTLISIKISIILILEKLIFVSAEISIVLVSKKLIFISAGIFDPGLKRNRLIISLDNSWSSSILLFIQN